MSQADGEKSVEQRALFAELKQFLSLHGYCHFPVMRDMAGHPDECIAVKQQMGGMEPLAIHIGYMDTERVFAKPFLPWRLHFALSTELREEFGAKLMMLGSYSVLREPNWDKFLSKEDLKYARPARVA